MCRQEAVLGGGRPLVFELSSTDQLYGLQPIALRGREQVV
jgi:hypothetical protein